MTDADRPDRRDLADGEVLAAYLDGETDEVTTARLERRLADEPALAARLDALAAARTRLQRLSEVRAPDDVRRRLRARIAEERAGGAPAHAAAPMVQRRRTWMAAVAPRLAVAVVALVALVALGAAVTQLLSGGASGSGAEQAAMGTSEPAGGAAAEDRGGAETGRAFDDTEAAAGVAGGSEAAAAGAPTGPVTQAAPTVEGDQEIVDRALRQPRRPPGNLRIRERRLRQRAGLATDRLCVAGLDALTVDLVQRGGRLVLALLLDAPAPQIVLVDPRTCEPQRLIPADS